MDSIIAFGLNNTIVGNNGDIFTSTATAATEESSFDNKQLITIFIACAPVSIVGSLFIIITWSIFAKLKHSGSNFIWFQAISDFLFTLKYIITIIFYYLNIPQFTESTTVNDPVSPYCFGLGLFSQFFGQATILWSFSMTIKVFHSYIKIKSNKPKQQQQQQIQPQQQSGEKSLKYYHLFVWGFCAINAAVVGVFKQYGPTSTGCWIVGSSNPFRLFELIPLYITITFSVIILILILIKMRKNRPISLLPTESQRYRLQEREFKVQLMKFILIFVIFWTPATILRTLEYFGIENKFFILLDAVSVSLQALANALVWATSKQFYTLLNKKIKGSRKTKQLEREYLINK
ncbi:hypothetical protein DICPUDRAFT_94711 [Dictyostelium purpureum]|uniref:G-protein coupled receptors family 2 profile 2 domain-containing protein n=1 Tax=Dictyostelium purpureum TaxID=5786 RepID=F0ZMP3_DICPU|nr:uncharacterized protein DICPUDRAFT_94711 [Dictyostelium purpureum]EGC34767.1 hypothetical protein DICPUDRAFT_94711 [Dictyostelium purpureum]|eukprot:XP_003288682.1 hypothetical protein DICPUDRAFT_94711 [Dictyostelium purpureum]